MVGIALAAVGESAIAFALQLLVLARPVGYNYCRLQQTLGSLELTTTVPVHTSSSLEHFNFNNDLTPIP